MLHVVQYVNVADRQVVSVLVMSNARRSSLNVAYRRRAGRRQGPVSQGIESLETDVLMHINP